MLVGALLLNENCRPVFGQEAEPTTTAASLNATAATTHSPLSSSSSSNSSSNVDRLVDRMLSKSNTDNHNNDESITSGNLGITLGDLEDLSDADQTENDDIDDIPTEDIAAAKAEAASTAAPTTAAKDTQDSRNIYRVARLKTPPLQQQTAMPTANNASLIVDNAVEVIDGSFLVYKELFDQTKWDAERISKAGLNVECTRHMRIFLNDLRQMIPWAMHGK